MHAVVLYTFNLYIIIYYRIFVRENLQTFTANSFVTLSNCYIDIFKMLFSL